MEKNTILKLIIQHLNEKGFKEVAEKIENETKTYLESPQLRNLQNSIQEGNYEESIKLVLENCKEFERISIIPKIRVRQIFELILTQKDKTLEFIRKIASSENFYEKDSTIERSVSLVFIQDKEILNKKMKELCPSAYSKEALIDYIKSILNKSNSLLKTLYPSSLENMLDTVIKNQIKTCKYHNTKVNSFSYFENHTCKKECIPYKNLITIEKHNEEIINITLSNNGNYFAASLKNNYIAIYQIILIEKENKSRKVSIECNNQSNSSNFKINNNVKTGINHINNVSNDMNIKSNLANKDSVNFERMLSGLNKPEDRDRFILEIKLINQINAHKGQITAISWHPNDKYIVTSSKDQTIKIFNPFAQNGTPCLVRTLESHNSMVTSVIFCQKDNKILSIGLDQNIFSWTFEGKSELYKKTNSTISEILYSQAHNYLISIEATNNSVIIYDYSTKNEVFKLQLNDAIISSSLSKIDKGGYLLINSSKATPVLNLFNLSTKEIEMKFFGHRQERFSIKCGFGGEDENFLVCGSEEAKIYVWNRYHSIPILAIKAHSAPVNAIIFPSFNNLSNIIISCSDDHTIKVFSTDLINKAYFDDQNKTLQHFMFVPGEKIICDQLNVENNVNNNISRTNNNIEEENAESANYSDDISD